MAQGALLVEQPPRVVEGAEPDPRQHEPSDGGRPRVPPGSHPVPRGRTRRVPGKESFVAPSAEGQIAAIEAALRDAAISPETLGYVEAHGTGTRLGDPVEIAALTEQIEAKRKELQQRLAFQEAVNRRCQSEMERYAGLVAFLATDDATLRGACALSVLAAFAIAWAGTRPAQVASAPMDPFPGRAPAGLSPQPDRFPTGAHAGGGSRCARCAAVPARRAFHQTGG